MNKTSSKVTCAGKTPEQVQHELIQFDSYDTPVIVIDWGGQIHRTTAGGFHDQMVEDQQAVKSSLVMQGV